MNGEHTVQHRTGLFTGIWTAIAIETAYEERDRRMLREKYLLDPGEHPSDGLVNIVTGIVVAHPSVNVHNDVRLEQTQMDSFEKTSPGGFHDTIPKVVNTMSFPRKYIKPGKSKVFELRLLKQ